MAAGDAHELIGFGAGTIAEEGVTTVTTGGTVALTSSGARNEFCARINRTSAASCNMNKSTSTTPPYPAGKTTGAMLVYMKFDTLPSATSIILTGTVIAGNDVQISVGTTGLMTGLYVGGTATAAVGTFKVGQWNRVEWTWDHTTTTHTSTLSMNGNTALTFTRPGTAATQVDGWIFGTPSVTAGTYNMSVSDLLIVDGATRTNADFRVVTIQPDGDISGTYTITGGTGTRFEAVDERPSDTTTTYIRSTTSSDIQVLGMSGYVLTGTESIKAVTFAGNLGSGAVAGTQTFTVVAQNGSGTDSGITATWSAAVAGWRKNSTCAYYPLNPAGGAWSQAELDGLRIKFTKSATADECRVGNCWAYVGITGLPAQRLPERTVYARRPGMNSPGGLRNLGNKANWDITNPRPLTAVDLTLIVTSGLLTLSQAAAVAQVLVQDAASLMTLSQAAATLTQSFPNVASLLTLSQAAATLRSDISAGTASLLTLSQGAPTISSFILNTASLLTLSQGAVTLTSLSTFTAPNNTLTLGAGAATPSSADIFAAGAASLLTLSQGSATLSTTSNADSGLLTLSQASPVLFNALAAASGLMTLSQGAPVLNQAISASPASLLTLSQAGVTLDFGTLTFTAPNNTLTLSMAPVTLDLGASSVLNNIAWYILDRRRRVNS